MRYIRSRPSTPIIDCSPSAPFLDAALISMVPSASFCAERCGAWVWATSLVAHKSLSMQRCFFG